MTFRPSMIAASVLFFANVALASPIPTSTDEARAMAGRASPTGGVSVVTTANFPTSTDEARLLAGRALPSSASRSVMVLARAPVSTDEARALAGGTARMAEPAGEHKDMVGCQQSCACKHG